MTDIKPEHNLAEILGINKLPENEQVEQIEKVGMMIINAAVGRLLVSLDESEVKELEDFLATSTGTEDVFQYLLETYPQFEGHVQDEVTGLYSEAEQILT
ncbi:hypothetical protein H6784_00660 [Candidatus Nomurabacteria bacterium]|nr:hypothetical protein [Candidatus Kaiserbacteria bacterium]MCB9813903.1 hypothetical protein [Candidatus Nomurabacteria bacterium]